MDSCLKILRNGMLVIHRLRMWFCEMSFFSIMLLEYFLTWLFKTTNELVVFSLEMLQYLHIAIISVSCLLKLTQLTQLFSAFPRWQT